MVPVGMVHTTQVGWGAMANRHDAHDVICPCEVSNGAYLLLGADMEEADL